MRAIGNYVLHTYKENRTFLESTACVVAAAPAEKHLANHAAIVDPKRIITTLLHLDHYPE